MPDTSDSSLRAAESSRFGARLSRRAMGLFMGGSLFAAYGSFAAILTRYLFPAREPTRQWLFVTDLDSLSPGSSVLFETPAGAQINVTRQGDGSGNEDFLALSSVCPHLGCQVHWEPSNDRFFCPCHNGVFSPEGDGIGGPPGDAGQSLPRFPLRVSNNLLFVEVPSSDLAQAPAQRTLKMANGEPEDSAANRGAPPGAGHDPCLYRKFPKV